MTRHIKKILISTMPRSGTIYLHNFIAELFQYSKLEPVFTGGSSPNPPEWDPYKFDKTYSSLANGQVLCAHYLLTDDIKKILLQPDVLTIYLYRDPRDAAVSAVLYIKNVLTNHPLYDFFSGLSISEAITFMLNGGIVKTEENKSEKGCGYINHEGMKYFCDSTLEWVAEPGVVKIRYEDLMHDSIDCLQTSLQEVGVGINEIRIQEVFAKLNFTYFSDGRVKGDEDVRSHFRKGVSGDYVNHFNELHKAICKQRIGNHLIKLGYEKDLCW